MEQSRWYLLPHIDRAICAFDDLSRYFYIRMLATGAARGGEYTRKHSCFPGAHWVQRRRRDLRRRQNLSHDIDDIELEPISNTLAGAVRHAIAQPDVGFLTNDGALPTSSAAISKEADVFTDSPGPSDIPRGPGNEYCMSGALQNV